METKEHILAKIIATKTGIIPDWVYDNTTEEVIIELLNIICYTSTGEPIYLEDAISFRISEFFKELSKRNTLVFSAIFDFIAGTYASPIVGLFLFQSTKQWKTMITTCRAMHTDISVQNIILTVLYSAVNMCNHIEDYQFNYLLDILWDNTVPSEFYDTVRDVFWHNFKVSPVGYSKESVDLFHRVAVVQKWHNSYEACYYLLERYVPILYHPGDISLTVMYLDCVIDNKYRITLDSEISHLMHIVGGGSRYLDNGIYNKLHTIATTLDANNLIYVMPITSKELSSVNTAIRFGSPGAGVNPVTDFNVLIWQFKNVNYIPVQYQLQFIKNGGDVTTMFENGELHPFATVLKLSDVLFDVIDNINDAKLSFLIENSSNFVANILNQRFLSMQVAIRIARVLFKYPFDKSLYEVLNNGRLVEATNDYRFLLARMIYISVPIEYLYKMVPKIMLYNRPNILQFYNVFPELKSEHIKYVPTVRITPYTKIVMGRNDPYIEFCRDVGNEKASLLALVDMDMRFLVTEIITNDEKYAYICDITDIDPMRLIDDIVNTKNER